MLVKIVHFRQNMTQLEHSACDRHTPDSAKQYVYCKSRRIYTVLKLATILTAIMVKDHGF